MATYNACRCDREGISILETVAEGTDFPVLARAYEKAKTVCPEDRITLRQGIRIINEAMPDGRSALKVELQMT